MRVVEQTLIECRRRSVHRDNMAKLSILVIVLAFMALASVSLAEKNKESEVNSNAFDMEVRN